jgi:hypothetical protein
LKSIRNKNRHEDGNTVVDSTERETETDRKTLHKDTYVERKKK